MTNSHPDAGLTLTEAYEKHYDKSDLTPNTAGKYKHELRRWERLTENPPVGEITNETLAAFRQAALDDGLTPRTVNSTWSTIRSILRRLGPIFTGNPWGLGIIPSVPAMKLCKVVRKRPRRIDLDDLTEVYLACKYAQCPHVGFPAVDWWRCLIVLAYTTGLRKSDLLSIEVEHIDFRNRRLTVCAQKTLKEDDLPLHDVAIEHIRRILPPEGKLFRGPYRRGGLFYKYWREIIQRAGVEHFGLHDLRRTGASEIDRVDRGLGKVFLQHAPHSVSDISYLNAEDELREAVDKMRLPVGFREGPEEAERYLIEKWRQQAEENAEQYTAPQYPNREDWRFFPGAFAYKGRRYKLTGAPLRVLKTLVEAGQPLGVEALAPVVMNGSYKGSDADQRYGRVRTAMANLRKALREIFGFGKDVDPVLCVAVDKSRGGGRWTVCLPPSIGENAA